MADGVGFEPTKGKPLPVFKTGPFNHSGTHPNLFIELNKSKFILIIKQNKQKYEIYILFYNYLLFYFK